MNRRPEREPHLRVSSSLQTARAPEPNELYHSRPERGSPEPRAVIPLRPHRRSSWHAVWKDEGIVCKDYGGPSPLSPTGSTIVATGNAHRKPLQMANPNRATQVSIIPPPAQKSCIPRQPRSVFTYANPKMAGISHCFRCRFPHRPDRLHCPCHFPPHLCSTAAKSASPSNPFPVPSYPRRFREQTIPH